MKWVEVGVKWKWQHGK